MRVFRLRERLHVHALLLLEHGDKWLVTNGGTVKTLVEKPFDTLEQVEQFVDDLPNRLMEHEEDDWDQEFQRFVEAENGRRHNSGGNNPDPGLSVGRAIET